jgi:hypothetical protein
MSTPNRAAPGSDLTLAIFRVTDLVAILVKRAVAEADRNARQEHNPVAASDYRAQRDYLQGCLEDLTREWATVMTVNKQSATFRQVR